MNIFKKNILVSIIVLFIFYIYPMKRIYNDQNSKQNDSTFPTSKEQKIYNMPVNEYFAWLNRHLSHNSLTKKDRDDIIYLAQIQQISLEDATINILYKKRNNNQFYPQ